MLINDCSPALIPRKIKSELEEILKTQKIKSVLVIGEARSCSTLLGNIAFHLKESGFKNVTFTGDNENFFSEKSNIVSAYKFLSNESNQILAWRILLDEIDNDIKTTIISTNYNNADAIIEALPDEFKDEHTKNAKVLQKILNRPKSERNRIAQSTIDKLVKRIIEDKKEFKEILIEQLVNNNSYLPRPLANIDITVCNILKSKGMGADIVFLIGFDQERIPQKSEVADSEIYQMFVALTRSKKRIYFIHTKDKKISSFIECIDTNLIKSI